MVLNLERAAIAGGIDVRLPTGNADNLLGTGGMRTKMYAAVGSKAQRFSPHVNFGYTFGSESDWFSYGSELGYAAGAEVVVNPRLTFLGDVLGRSIADVDRMTELTTSVPLPEIHGFFPAEQKTITTLEYNPRRLNSTLGTIGAKFSPTSTMVVSAHILFPMTDGGLKTSLTPVIGIDYTF
jgi:hypothetical protein